MSKAKIGVGILGGSGYGAGELLRLLVHHPEVTVVSVTSSSQAGTPIAAAHPHLNGFYSLTFDAELALEKLSAFPQSVVFASLPHGTSATEISALVTRPEAKDVRLIDLSGDFRLLNEAVHHEHYPESPFLAELRAKFAYGLPELNRERIRTAQYVANPGCLASACALAVAPVVDRDFPGMVVFDAKTGTSGGGKSPQPVFHHPTRHSNFVAYKILQHRHEPEIRQALGDLSGTTLQTAFIPHLLPSSRGIFVTAYLTLPGSAPSIQDLRARYEEFYAPSPFIRFRTASPELQHVLGSNFCDVAIFLRGNQFVAMTALDNLVKGMAGMAIQNLNLICGLPEMTGLQIPALGPM